MSAVLTESLNISVLSLISDHLQGPHYEYCLCVSVSTETFQDADISGCVALSVSRRRVSTLSSVLVASRAPSVFPFVPDTCPHRRVVCLFCFRSTEARVQTDECSCYFSVYNDLAQFAPTIPSDSRHDKKDATQTSDYFSGERNECSQGTASGDTSKLGRQPNKTVFHLRTLPDRSDL